MTHRFLAADNETPSGAVELVDVCPKIEEKPVFSVDEGNFSSFSKPQKLSSSLNQESGKCQILRKLFKLNLNLVVLVLKESFMKLLNCLIHRFLW